MSGHTIEKENTHSFNHVFIPNFGGEFAPMSKFCISELMSLKDSCLPKNVNSAKFSHVINCPGENVKQERQRTEERLKVRAVVSSQILTLILKVSLKL